MGLSDIALAAIGVDPESLTERRERGTGTTAAELTGALGSLVLGVPTPVGLLGRAGSAIAKGRGLAGAATAGAFEGAVYDGTNALAEQVLQDTPISADAIASRALRGAAFGGAAASLVRGLSAAARRAPKQPNGAALPKAETLAKKVEDAALGEESASWRALFRKKDLTTTEVRRAAGGVLAQIDNLSASRRAGNKLLRETMSAPAAAAP